MIYGSVCSGIEAATQAWHSLGWRPAFFAEIEKFPSAVLKKRWPGVPNVGDLVKVAHGEIEVPAIQLLVGGTPCQSFSISGLGGGLSDERGVLSLEFLRLAERKRPRWVVWENVPGVLSNDGGRAFGTILGGLAKLGYGWAYRVLDAQHFGVAQRRHRVFVVGCLGNAAAAAAVLFERSCLRGDLAPSREAREDVAGTLTASAARGSADEGERGTLLPFIPSVAHPLTSEGFDASEDGTGRGQQRVAGPFLANAEGSEEITLTASCGAKGVNNQTPLVVSGVARTIQAHQDPNQLDAGALVIEPTVFDLVQITSVANRSNPTPGAPTPTISQSSRPHLAFHTTQDPISGPVAPAIGTGSTGSTGSTGTITPSGLVRRLTPREYERLFGFPDDYTLITPETKDGPRYRALGNSMAVPVMRWIGHRIEQVDRLLTSTEPIR